MVRIIRFLTALISGLIRWDENPSEGIIGRIRKAYTVSVHQEKTKALLKAGSYEKALSNIVWFHHHALEYNPGLYGVRLSYALADWIKLGEVYPPALKALKQIRDDGLGLIIEGVGTKDLFHDVASINNALGENKSTSNLFRIIDRDFPSQAKEYWSLAKDTAINLDIFDLSGKYVTDPEQELKEFVKEYRSLRWLLFWSQDFSQGGRNIFVRKSEYLIRILIETNRLDAAYRIQQKALRVVSDDRLRILSLGDSVD